jgi:hypothetical protein
VYNRIDKNQPKLERKRESRGLFPRADRAPSVTRVAGVSTWVLHRGINGWDVYQFWADGSYGPYLWEALLEIAREPGGDVIGLSAFFSEV